MKLNLTPLPFSAALLFMGISAISTHAQTFDPNWPAPDDVVDVVAYDPGSDQVFIGGSFANVGGQPRSYLASYNASTGALTSWAPTLDAYVGAMAVSGTTLYVGGGFSTINGQASDALAAFNITTGQLISDWHPSAGPYVYDMAIGGSTLYIAGDFSDVAGVTFYSVAGVDAGGFGFPVTWSGDYCSELAWGLAVSGNTVYTGGQFYTIGGQTRPYIAALSTATGHATTWNPTADSDVSTLAVSGTTVYAGGSFSHIGGQYRQHLAALSTASGLASAWDPAPNSGVGVVLPSGNSVYVGGGFTTIGGQSRNGFAAVDATTGNATAWNPGLADGPNPIFVYSVATNGTHLYVGGDFATVNGVSHPYFAAWSGVLSGVTELPAVPAFDASPNPTSGALRLDVNDATARTVEAVNVLGERALLLPFQRSIDLSGLPAGSYSLTVRDVQGEAIARTRVVRE